MPAVGRASEVVPGGSVLTESQMERIWSEFEILNSVQIRALEPHDTADAPAEGEVAIFLCALQCGLRLPLHPFVRALTAYLGLAPGQFTPNAWRVLISSFIIWRQVGNPELTLEELVNLYLVKHDSHEPWYYFATRGSKGLGLVMNLPSSNKDWKNKWFWASGEWEALTAELGCLMTRVPTRFSSPGMAEASGSRRRKAAPTVDEMLRAELGTKTVVRRRQAAPRGEGPSAPVSVVAPPAATPISFAATSIVAPAVAEAAAADAMSPHPPLAVAPHTIAAPPVALARCIAVPSSSEREEAVRMADAMLSPPEVGDDHRAEAQALVGSRTEAGEAMGSAQVGTSEERFEPGYHMSCLAHWAAKNASDEEIANLLHKSDESFINDMTSVFYRSISKLLIIWERLREFKKREAEVDALKGEARILRDEAAFLRMEQAELCQQLEDVRARELQLQVAMSELETRCGAVADELTRGRAHADSLAKENARLGEVLERTRAKAIGEQSRAVSQAKEAQRAEDEASLAVAVAAAVEAFKASKERTTEATKFYNCGFDACIEAVQDLYPDLNLEPLLPEDAGEKPAEDVRPDQGPSSPAPPPPPTS
ncbi:uncharacterized protein LOC131224961 [Magnolia sinica]|uniref:uncharacterized protein LOC131224961 n=1 Tax=Magnolia sinica TaxID=86752 RepID=UPI002657E0AE|nr:uncharacterized protein LOC131224961 [Magnolia sinica]